jgi:hypothetical protein
MMPIDRKDPTAGLSRLDGRTLPTRPDANDGEIISIDVSHPLVP